MVGRQPRRLIHRSARARRRAGDAPLLPRSPASRGRVACLMSRCQEHTARHGPTNSRPDVGLPDQSFRVAMTAPRRSRQRAPQIPTVLEHPGIDLSLPASPLGGGGLMPIRECCPPPLDARLLPAPVAGYRPRPFLAGAVETSYLSLARANVQNRIAILHYYIVFYIASGGPHTRE